MRRLTFLLATFLLSAVCVLAQGNIRWFEIKWDGPLRMTPGNANIGIGAAPDGTYKLLIVGDVRINSGDIFGDDDDSGIDLGLNQVGLLAGGNTRLVCTGSQCQYNGSEISTAATGFNINGLSEVSSFEAGDFLAVYNVSGSNQVKGRLDEVVGDVLSAGSNISVSGTQISVVAEPVFSRNDLDVINPQVELEQQGGGDAMLRLSAGGIDWDLKVDNSAGDAFVVAENGTQRLALDDGGVNITMPTAGTGNPVKRDAGGNLFEDVSSARFKTGIGPLKVDSALIYRLLPRSYRNTRTGTDDFNLVAEEVAKVLPELATYDADGITPRGVKLDRLPVLLLAEMKVLRQRQQWLSALLCAMLIAGAVYGGLRLRARRRLSG